MPRVDFYILQPGQSPQRFACDMTLKVRRLGHAIHIHAGSRPDAVALDAMLWTFKDIAFLPHRLADAADDGSEVTLGWAGITPGEAEVLINLSDEVPEFAGRCARVVETVEHDAPEQARARYRRYRDLDFELHTHKLDAEQADA